jgi:opacity protein-like surface antigen
MKNFILSMLSFCICSTISLGQKTFLSLGPELAIPGNTESMKMNAGTGFGGSLRLESVFGSHVSGTATVSLLFFAEKQQTYITEQTKTKVTMVPLEIGLKYYFPRIEQAPKGIFLSLETGLMPVKTHFDYQNNPDNDFRETGWAAAFGAGYLSWKIESSFRFQYNLTAGGYHVYYYNFRIAYAFL